MYLGGGGRLTRQVKYENNMQVLHIKTETNVVYEVRRIEVSRELLLNLLDS